MSNVRVSIVVVPRERFSAARASLQSIFANTENPFELIYVDGCSPRPLRRWLAQQAAERGFRLLRRDHYLSPNEARNIGLAAVETELVVFIDNDVLVRPGWLAKLIECADETGAAAVGPLTCEYGFDTVHFAGGEVEITEEREGEGIVRRVRDKMYFPQRKVESVSSELARREVKLCEFHCVLADTAALRRIGGFDERMLNTREHLDFSLALANIGGSVWFEPDSVVAFLPPPPLRLSDLHFYMLRWSDDWERRSLAHFRAKWNLRDDEFFKQRLARLGWRRQTLTVDRLVRRLTLGRGNRTIERALQRLERGVNDYLTRRYARARPAGGTSPGPA